MAKVDGNPPTPRTRRAAPPPPSAFPCPASRLAPRASRLAFTLTELLIVIAIIAVLAALATAGAVRAMQAARRASISLELKQLGGAMDNFKNDYGAYPPNGMNPSPTPVSNPPAGTVARLLESDFEGMFRKMFPKHRESEELVEALCGQGPNNNFNLANGMTASEALYFWLGGFSDDELYPISGPRGPSFLVVNGDESDEVIEDRNRRYEFDLARLRPVDGDGALDWSAVRYLQYQDPKNPNQNRRINFWRYNAKGSEQPIVYFDVSRHKPGPLTMRGRYDMWAASPDSPTNAPPIYALKQLRRGVKNANNNYSNIVFVEQGKCQVLHCGLDDEWGEEFNIMGALSADVSGANDLVLYPEGPFVGEVSDTLGNFFDGTLEDAQEAAQ